MECGKGDAAQCESHLPLYKKKKYNTSHILSGVLRTSGAPHVHVFIFHCCLGQSVRVEGKHLTK